MDSLIIPKDTRYWLIRTKKGKFFDEFYTKNYVAIDHNTVTYKDLIERPSGPEIREIVADALKVSIDNKAKITSMLNKQLAFIHMKPGDKVMIPNASSFEFAIGEVLENGFFTDNINVDVCPFEKRVKIRWIAKKLRSELDPIFFRMKINQHGLSSIDDYAKQIDRITNSVFVKDDTLSVVFNIGTENKINILELKSFIDNFVTLMEKIKNSEESIGDLSEISIKLRLNSKGQVTVQQPIRQGNDTNRLILRSTLFLATSIFASSCSDRNIVPQNAVEQYRNEYQTTLDSLVSVKDTMSMDLDSIDREIRRTQ